jgi:hypothetical protein
MGMFVNTGGGQQWIPDFNVNDLQEIINTSGNSDSGYTNTPTGRYELQNVGSYFPGTGWTSLGENNWSFSKDPDTGKWSLMLKSGDKEGTVIPLTESNGKLVPDQSAVSKQSWNTNPDWSWVPGMLAMYGGAQLAQGMLGNAATGAAEAGTGAATATGTGGYPLGELGSGLYGTGEALTPFSTNTGLLNSAGLTTLEGVGAGTTLLSSPQAGVGMFEGLNGAGLLNGLGNAGFDVAGAPTTQPGYTPPTVPTTSPPGTTPPGGNTTTTTTTSAAKSSSLVKDVATWLGVDESTARLILTLAPAAISAIAGGGDEKTTRTGDPVITEAQQAVANAATKYLPEGMARDRQRADQQMGWGNLLVPAAQGLTAQPSIFNKGLTAGYVPRRGILG